MAVPMNFDTGIDGADANMDGRAPIRPVPKCPPTCGTRSPRTANFNAQVESEVERRVQSSETEQEAALAAAGADGQRTAALATLGAMIEGIPATPLTRFKFRGAVRIWFSPSTPGSDKPPAEHVAEAMRLNEARVQQIAATSGETSRAISSERSTPTVSPDTRPSPAPTWARCSTSRSGSAKAWTARS